MSEPPKHQPPHGLNVPAGVGAMLFPGLGHIIRGEPKRGVMAAIGVLGMFFGGMLIGGIDIVDSREDKWWYYGQAFVGPIAWGVDWAHQNQFKAHGIPGNPPEAGEAGVFKSSDRQLLREHQLRSVFPNEQRVVVDVEVAVGNGVKVETRRLPVAIPVPNGDPDAGPPNKKSLAKVNEIGTLYALCAGMLNLIVILDALFPTIRPKRSPSAGNAAKNGGGDA